jgi:hypothetical protein
LLLCLKSSGFGQNRQFLIHFWRKSF